MAQVDVIYCFGIDGAAAPAVRAFAERLGYNGDDSGIEELCDGRVVAWFADPVEYSSEMSDSEWDEAGGEPVSGAACEQFEALKKELAAAGVRVLSSEITPESWADISRAEAGIDITDNYTDYARYFQF